MNELRNQKVPINYLQQPQIFQCTQILFIFHKYLPFSGFINHYSILIKSSLRDLRVKGYKKSQSNCENAYYTISQELIIVLTLSFATEEYCYVVIISCLVRIHKFCFKR